LIICDFENTEIKVIRMSPTRHTQLKAIGRIDRFPIPFDQSKVRTMASQRPRVLCYGHEEMLLYTRKRILEQEFLVDRCEDVTCLEEKLSRGPLDLLLLCQSVPEAECVEVINLVRAASPEVKVLVLEAGLSGSCSLQSDAAMGMMDGPPALLDKIHALLGIAPPGDAHPA
jgi:hypothetical protein